MSGRRGTGIAVLAGVTGFRGIFGMFQATILLAVSTRLSGTTALFVLLMAGLLVLISILQMVAAAGIWSMSSLGWMLGVSAYLFDVLVGALMLLLGAGAATLLVPMIVDGGALTYLLISKERYGGSSADREEMVAGADKAAAGHRYR